MKHKAVRVIVGCLVALTLTGCSSSSNADYQKAQAYYKGHGVSQDYTKADYWWRKAAHQGYAPGEAELGLSYLNGRGVPLNNNKGIYWLREATRQGNAQAERGLSAAYGFALGYGFNSGVPPDYVAAYKWAAIAVASGKDDAKGRRMEVIWSSHMTQHQIAEAQVEAVAWMKKHPKH